MDFGYVPPPLPKWIWERVEDLIAPAAARGGCDLADVERDIRAGIAQLWVTRADTIVSACITRIEDGDCTIWLMGGDIADLQWLPTIEAAARGRGCKRMWLKGRKGWTRALTEYVVTSKDGSDVVMEKCL